MSIAIAMTAWKRPEYLSPTLDSWAFVRDIEGIAERCVFIDRSQEDTEYSMECLSSEHGWRHHTRKSHHGVLVNPVEAVNDMFRLGETDFVILAEEDVVVTADILEYFAWAQQFRDDQSIATVCAHRPQETTVEGMRSSAVIRMLGFSCPLVWGTWRDRWESFIAPYWDRDYRANGWDYNLVRMTRLSGRYTLFPEQNRSDHIGKERGVHCSAEYFDHTIDPDFTPDIGPQQYEIVEGPSWARSSG